MRPRLAWVRGVELLLAAGVPRRAPARDTTRVPPPPAPPAERKPVACNGQRVDDIVVHSLAPTIAALRDVPVLAELARSIHTTTRPDIVRRYLLLTRGDACTELRRAESERILRAQPFLADASVQAFESDSGGADLEGRRIDETSGGGGGRITSS